MDERAAPMARRRVDDEPRGFVHDDYILVVVDHLERHVLRLEVERLRGRHDDAERVALRNLDRGLYAPLRRQLRVALFDELLRIAAADAHEAGEREVEPVAVELRAYRKFLKRRGSGLAPLPLFLKAVVYRKFFVISRRHRRSGRRYPFQRLRDGASSSAGISRLSTC